MSDPKRLPVYIRFAIGGLSGMTASCFVHPMDLVKFRMQMSGVKGQKPLYANPFDCFMKIVRNDGVFKLWRGVGAAMLQQATFTAGRIGCFQMLVDNYKVVNNEPPGVGVSLLIGMTAGAFGALLGNPAEMALIRITTDANLPPAERRNYKNAYNAVVRISKEEGLKGLYIGLTPATIRAMVVTMIQLTSYSKLKIYFKNKFQLHEGLGLHSIASSLSGLLTATISMPLDLAKTRIQNMKTKPGEKPPYSGTADVLMKIVKGEGVLSLWKGFTPYLLRICPHTILVLVCLEKYSNLYCKYVLGVEGVSGL